MVIAWPPDTARRLGAQRRYIPFNVPLVKRVAAAPGDTVCALGPVIFVEGRAVARRLAVDARRRPMPWWSGCVTLRDGAMLLLMDSPASFDGRSEEHTSELQSLMRISSAVFCLKKKKHTSTAY